MLQITILNLLKKPDGAQSNSYNFNHTHAVRYMFNRPYENGNGVIYTNGETVPSGVIASHDSNWSNIPSVGFGDRIVLGDKSISTLQPYITCYMWKRTA